MVEIVTYILLSLFVLFWAYGVFSLIRDLRKRKRNKRGDSV